MASTSIRALCVSALVCVGSLGAPAAAQTQVVYDEDMTRVSFTDPTYPSLALSARVAGNVVVTVVLNDDGSVKSAVALSGPRLLVTGATDNARTWRFRPNRQQRAVIVYEFRLAPICVDGPAIVRVIDPNIASVTGCVPLWQATSPR
jgi:TonB family protein